MLWACCLLPMLLFSLQPCLSNEPPHIDKAKQYLFVTEKTGGNDGEPIETWQRFVGVPIGSPYCAAFVSYILNEVKAIYPDIVSAVATSFITEESIDADDVYDGRASVDNSYLSIWRSGKTWKGHVGFVYLWEGVEGYVIEANTSPGYKGSQRNGGGVYMKHRAIEPDKYFRIVAFTKIKYEDKWKNLKTKLSGLHFWVF